MTKYYALIQTVRTWQLIRYKTVTTRVIAGIVAVLVFVAICAKFIFFAYDFDEYTMLQPEPLKEYVGFILKIYD